MSFNLMTRVGIVYCVIALLSLAITNTGDCFTPLRSVRCGHIIPMPTETILLTNIKENPRPIGRDRVSEGACSSYVTPNENP